MQKQTSFLLLGGNLGNRLATLAQAREVLGNKAGTVLAQSPIYETAAWGVTDQPAFLNQVIKIETALSPLALLFCINQIEAALGRQRHERWHARTIDIDILYYADQVIESQRLTVPHPQLHKRKFTLIPLATIAPDDIHPILQKTNQVLLSDCADDLEVHLFVE